MRPSPAVCAELPTEPVLPDAAGLVAPVSPEEKAATSAFLNWSAELDDYARRLAERLKAAQTAACAP